MENLIRISPLLMEKVCNEIFRVLREKYVGFLWFSTRESNRTDSTTIPQTEGIQGLMEKIGVKTSDFYVSLAITLLTFKLMFIY